MLFQLNPAACSIVALPCWWEATGTPPFYSHARHICVSSRCAVDFKYSDEETYAIIYIFRFTKC